MGGVKKRCVWVGSDPQNILNNLDSRLMHLLLEKQGELNLEERRLLYSRVLT